MDGLHYYLCFSQMENDMQLGNTETEKKPWTPSAVGWISHFLKDHWPPQGTDGRHQGSPPFPVPLSQAFPHPGLGCGPKRFPPGFPLKRDTFSFKKIYLFLTEG